MTENRWWCKIEPGTILRFEHDFPSRTPLGEIVLVLERISVKFDVCHYSVFPLTGRSYDWRIHDSNERMITILAKTTP